MCVYETVKIKLLLIRFGYRNLYWLLPGLQGDIVKGEDDENFRTRPFQVRPNNLPYPHSSRTIMSPFIHN